MKNVFSIALSLIMVMFVAGFVLAQSEHPKEEHPKKSEHPAKKMTTADIDSAIQAHIADMSKADGLFHVKDAVMNKTWNLSLVKVHKDKLTALDSNNYFACVDFKADDGTAVDVDFYMKDEGGKLGSYDRAQNQRKAASCM
jgi:hypothetical protein